MTPEKILSLLPYSEPFLFVDSIDEVDEYRIRGSYKFRKDEFFYKGHFKDNPVTPGVILIEVMAQIGLVCFGISLLNDELTSGELKNIAFVSARIDFMLPVLPGEKVSVISEKIYFRFGKLKCKVEMKNEKGDTAAAGEIAGMVIK